MSDTAVSSQTLSTGTYHIDPAHTRIGFVARHAMVTKVRGAFKEFAGTGYFNAEDPTQSTLEVTIQGASVDTGNADRDAHLKSNDFLDLENYSEITFRSTSIERVSGDEYNVTGDLTIKGVTRSLTIPFDVSGPVQDPWGNQRVGLEGKAEINRKDYGVSFNVALEAGGLLVSDKIVLEFDVAAVKAA
jgi:polyisoprenoid-binding protein YceI